MRSDTKIAMRSVINVMFEGDRGFRDPKERTISSSRSPQVQLRGVFERYKGDLIDHVNPPSKSVRGILIGREKAGDEDGRKRRRKRRRGSEKGGSQQKLN